MHICICNPFSDKDVRKKLDGTDGKTTVKEVYRCCSGGEKPNCGTCIDTLKSLVQEHNNKRTVADLKRALPETAALAKKSESV